MKPKKTRQCIVALLMVGMQILPTVSTLIFSSAIAAESSYSQAIESVGAPAPASQSASNVAASMASNYAADSVEHWLQQFGTARVQLNVDDKGNWDNSAVDLLMPFYANKYSYTFTQLGLRAPDGRTTGNIGLGMRMFNENWMYGGNIFFDNDFTGQNRRIGFGAEAWTNYLKFSANTYFAISNWHDSRDFDDYYEKPANGFDTRAEGYLPSLPQLGAKIMYEQYYGSNVALFDKDHLQNNPSAITVGLNYTPIPLITAGIDYKRGQDSIDETQITLNFRYSFGQSFKSQISPSEVDGLRQLNSSRYDLVDRNNEIVLQYKKKAQDAALANLKLYSVKDNSPADGITANGITVQAVAIDGTPVKNAVINWSSGGHAKLSTTTGVTDGNGQTSVQLTNTSAEQVSVQATSGSVSQSINSSFIPSVAALNLKLTQNNAAADGNAQNAGTVTVKDTDGNVMANVPVTWTVDKGAAIVNSDSTTDSHGNASVHFSSKNAGSVTLKATAAGKNESIVASFIAQNVAKLDLTVTSSTTAVGTPDTAQATVTDDSGKPIADLPVQWSITGSATFAPAATASSNTNSGGNASIGFSDTRAETVTLTATVGGKTASQTIVFTAGEVASVKVSVVRDKAAADGISQNIVQAKITDASNNPVAGATVNWSQDGSAVVGTGTPTNAQGESTVTLTDSKAETVNLTATVNGQHDAQPTTFVAGAVAQVTVTVDDNNVTADGSSPLQAHATVTDSNGNPVPDLAVTWSQDGSAAVGTSTQTDSRGVSNVTLTDTKAETVQLTATVNGQTDTKPARFVAGAAASVAVIVDTDNVTADGSSPLQAHATVTDSNGNPVPDLAVTWSQDGSATVGTSTQTDSRGISNVTLTDTKAETVQLTATVNGQTDTKPARFVAGAAASVAVIVDTNNVTADGTTPLTAHATVIDANGNAVPGTTVTWSQNGSAVVGSPTQTDIQGISNVTLTDTKAETVQLTATVNGQTDTKPARFVAGAATSVAVIVDTNNVTADGTTPLTAHATVTDSNGNPVPDLVVTWSQDGSATVGTSTQTDIQGISNVTLTDTKAETVRLTATVGGISSWKLATFISTAPASITLTASPTSVIADGHHTIAASVIVKDSNGNNVADGTQVTWSAVSATPASTTTTTTAGFATVAYTSTTAGDDTLTATVGNISSDTSVSFTAQVFGTLNFENPMPTGTVNGVPVEITVTLHDSSGYPITGATITWGTVSGNAIAAQTTSMTDLNGIAVMNYSSTTVGSNTISANYSGHQSTAVLRFTP